MLKKVVLIIFIVIAIAIPVRFFMLGSQSAEMKVDVGMVNNQLRKCPEKPNCVSSFEPLNDEHYIKPGKANPATLPKVKEIANNMGLKLISEKSYYLHFEAASTIFGFVDDVEFFSHGGNLYFRSASRVGYSDMGANRKRMEKFREKLN